MASDQLPVNGTFAPAQTQAYPVEQAPITHAAADSVSDVSGGAAAEVPKDEVGWYFVEQYYTVLSKNPEKLYLFYNKRSQFVSGSETEKVNVCVGQKAIDERIKALDIQDCKVRVTNVDSQGSGQNIVIQVIGEMSNKTTPRTKFAQTFVLAEQTNGYFVLNDIFRYMVDDDEEVEGEEIGAAPNESSTGYQETAAAEPLTLTNSENAAEREQAAQLVDQGLEEAMEQTPAVAAPAKPTINGTGSADAVVAEDAPVAATVDPEVDDATTTVPVHQDAAVEAEKPTAPQSTPAPIASPAKSAAQPAAPKPAVPKTWANLVAGGNKPAAAAVAAAAAAQAAPTAAAAPSAPAKSVPASVQEAVAPVAPAPQDSEAADDTPQSSGSEWQTAQRYDHSKKQQRPQSIASPVANTRAYMKNIGEAINEDMLRAALNKHGELTYLDISRQKNCAFADFATPAAYQAAVAANPHEVNGERVYVEERRVRPQSFGGNFGARGGMAPRGGRGGAPTGQGRGGFQKDGGRGSFSGRGRGGANGPRGRGVSQPA